MERQDVPQNFLLRLGRFSLSPQLEQWVGLSVLFSKKAPRNRQCTVLGVGFVALAQQQERQNGGT